MDASERKLRMRAYWYSFEPTGDHAIDLILSAVACAGKAFHYTEQWNEECSYTLDEFEGKTPVEWIQNAAKKAAIIRAELAKNASGERMSDDEFSEYEGKTELSGDLPSELYDEANRARASESALLARVAELEAERDKLYGDLHLAAQQNYLTLKRVESLESALAAANARADKAEARITEAQESDAERAWRAYEGPWFSHADTPEAEQSRLAAIEHAFKSGRKAGRASAAAELAQLRAQLSAVPRARQTR